MSEKLHRLFDYQRFSRNGQLQKLIDETTERYSLQYEYGLADSSLALVSGGKKQIDEEAKKDKEERV